MALRHTIKSILITFKRAKMMKAIAGRISVRLIGCFHTSRNHLPGHIFIVQYGFNGTAGYFLQYAKRYVLWIDENNVRIKRFYLAEYPLIALLLSTSPNFGRIQPENRVAALLKGPYQMKGRAGAPLWFPEKDDSVHRVMDCLLKCRMKVVYK